jgi:leucyl-tRNA synthetase
VEAGYQWMRGFNPFGLPAENAAIANQRHLREWTLRNIDISRRNGAGAGLPVEHDPSRIPNRPGRRRMGMG